MLLKTHLAFAVLLIIFFIGHVADKTIFIAALIIGTMLPDVDTAVSNIGKRGVMRPLQFFVRHRGIIHSLTFALFLSIILAIFFPVACLGFFLGYSVHLFCDSFTKQGVQPFWPWKAGTHGIITTGGKVEMSLFVTVILIDVVLAIFAILG